MESEVKVDHADLLGFFGVLPESQDPEELEFFSAPAFIKRVEGVRISVSISTSHNDLYLDLTQNGANDHLLQYRLVGIVALEIDTRKDGRTWLTARSNSMEEISISVDPTIAVVIRGSQDSA